jgi:PKD repeat protein
VNFLPEDTSYLWDFGDDSTSTEIEPIHVYTQPGAYTVTLRVESLFGSHTLTETEFISVTEPAAPVAYFSATPLSGSTPLQVSFTDQSAGGPTSWLWDFGDTITSTLQNPVHTYVNPGVYTVTLTVSNDLGEDSLVREDYITVIEVEYRTYLPLVIK